jgi:hypothetical protein
MTRTEQDSANTTATSSPAPRPVTVELPADGGALIRDTTKGDDVERQALQLIGARWSRTLQAWYLPRTLRTATRDMKIRQLVDAMTQAGRAVDVVAAGAPLAAAQQRSDRADRLAERADRLEARAARRQEASDAAYATVQRISDSIPLGQPILIGHYSERRHRADLARSAAALTRSVDAQRQATDAQRRADSILQRLERGDSPVTIARRLDRLQAERRAVQRLLDRPQATAADVSPASAHQQLLTRAAEIDDEVAVDQAALAQLQADGHITDWSQAGIAKGDQVLFRGCWLTVARVNRTTVTVQTDHSWTHRLPWRELSGHRRTDLDKPANPTHLTEKRG